MEFKVGDRVIFKPESLDDKMKGVITSETTGWGTNVIEWEDGSKGEVYLKTAGTYLMHVTD